MASAYPFSAIVGQEEMKLALMIAAIDRTVGGVLILGDRGTGKSTAVRGLAQLLPPITVVAGCPYNCAPDQSYGSGASKQQPQSRPCAAGCANANGGASKSELVQVPVVDLPLGATEDRVVGALDLERALTRGEKAFEPGLLARAHRGFLYIDEVNLLEDHLVDLLLDVAASGENVVEREGLSVRHPAQFVLIGTGNPEEGELRPQLLDRFGLAVDVTTPTDVASRVEVIKRRDAYERNRGDFIEHWRAEENKLTARLEGAQERLGSVDVPDHVLTKAAELCIAVGSDGLRGELTLVRAGRALAALEGQPAMTFAHLQRVASPVLRHRLRRMPLDDSGSSARVDRALGEVLGHDNALSLDGA